MEKISKKVQDIILYGSGEDELRFTYDDGTRNDRYGNDGKN